MQTLNNSNPPAPNGQTLKAQQFNAAFVPTQTITAYVTAAVDLRAMSGLVIPKGTYGRLLEINRHGLAFVDFGNQAVYAVSYGSPLICWSGEVQRGR